MSRRSEPPGGDFRYEHPIEVRFVDTDAFGHVNNATFLSYFEAARAGYYARVTGSPFMTGEHGLKHTFVIAEARIAYRSPVLFGEPLLAGVRFAWVGGSRSRWNTASGPQSQPSAKPASWPTARRCR